MFGLFRQIGPFVRIDPVIVEFLAAVLVTDVTPVFGAYRGVAFPIGRNGRRAEFGWIGELCFDRRAIELIGNLNTGEIDQ